MSDMLQLVVDLREDQLTSHRVVSVRHGKLQRLSQNSPSMPWPCAVEPHARRYDQQTRFVEMPRACPVESHAPLLTTYERHKPINVRRYKRESTTAQGRGIDSEFCTRP